MAQNSKKKLILWWGRFDPDYSRNRIVRHMLRRCGYTLNDFRPRASFLGSIESYFTGLERPDAVWVGAFRHRDFRSARRFADRHQIPLIFDPLISSWDKAVFERAKFAPKSTRAERLLTWEKSLFSQADIVIADTEPHARFFIEVLSAPREHTHVLEVGAEESLFKPQPTSSSGEVPEILFYGSFINLQGPDIIIEAARYVPQARWTFLGDGPLRGACEMQAAGCSHISFEGWLAYEQLPARIGKADILLGIFGASPKAGRVIPNKVFQALACGRPVITRESEAYPEDISTGRNNGLIFVSAGRSDLLAGTLRDALAAPDRFAAWGAGARRTYETHFAEAILQVKLTKILADAGLSFARFSPNSSFSDDPSF